MPDLAIVVLVLKPGVLEVDARIEVREVVLARPCGDVLRLASRAPVAVGSPAVRLLQELLVLAFQFVVEDDAPYRCATLVEALLRPQVGSVDLCVVRQLARLPQARIELLPWFVVALEAAALQQIPATLGEYDDVGERLSSGIRSSSPEL